MIFFDCYSGKFYYALYPFEPGPAETTMMKVDKGQVLRVVQVIMRSWV